MTKNLVLYNRIRPFTLRNRIVYRYANKKSPAFAGLFLYVIKINIGKTGGA